jgi:hypothetical protein
MGRSFDLVVCTPKWLERTRVKDVVFSGCHYLFVKE